MSRWSLILSHRLSIFTLLVVIEFFVHILFLVDSTLLVFEIVS